MLLKKQVISILLFIILVLVTFIGNTPAVIIAPIDIVFQTENENYTTNESMDFSQIVISDTYLQFNDSAFHIDSSNYININIEYINEDFEAAQQNDKVLGFYADTASGNVFFNISGFKIGMDYSVYKAGALYDSVTANASGFVTFNSTDWSEKLFELYQTQQGTIQFVDINGNDNGSTIYDSTPVFNWTRISSTTQYHLQISNTSGVWTDAVLAVNLSDINQLFYPTYYSENATQVSFILPPANALSAGGLYYCRVRPYVES